MSESNSVLKSYRFPIILLGAIALGCVIGAVMGERALVLKPLGDLFINAMFMVVVPLVFSTICSAVASMSSMERLGKVMKSLVVVFTVTGAIAALLMLVTVTLFPPAEGVHITLDRVLRIQALSTPDQIVKAVTTDDFVKLLSRNAMLPLILFTIFFGFCLQSLGERGRAVGRGIGVFADAMLRWCSTSCTTPYRPHGLLRNARGRLRPEAPGRILPRDSHLPYSDIWIFLRSLHDLPRGGRRRARASAPSGRT